MTRRAKRQVIAAPVWIAVLAMLWIGYFGEVLIERVADWCDQ